MTYFIIKHKATGRLMPNRAGRSAGSTWWEPTLVSAKTKEVPRLFLRKIDAINSVKWWLNGSYSSESYRSSHESFQDDDWRLVKHKPQFPRKEGDLEIIEVELREVGQMELPL